MTESYWIRGDIFTYLSKSKSGIQPPEDLNANFLSTIYSACCVVRISWFYFANEILVINISAALYFLGTSSKTISIGKLQPNAGLARFYYTSKFGFHFINFVKWIPCINRTQNESWNEHALHYAVEIIWSFQLENTERFITIGLLKNPEFMNWLNCSVLNKQILKL